MPLRQGYISPLLRQPTSRMEAILEEPTILLHRQEDRGLVQNLVPCSSRLPRTAKPLLIRPRHERKPCHRWVGETARVCFNVAASRPGFGIRRKAMLEDIAVLTMSLDHRGTPALKLRTQAGDLANCPPHHIKQTPPPSWPMQRSCRQKPGRQIR